MDDKAHTFKLNLSHDQFSRIETESNKVGLSVLNYIRFLLFSKLSETKN